MDQINYKEILDKIKGFFMAPMQPMQQPMQPQGPASYTLEDGTPVEISAMQVGGTATMGGQSLPDGEYTLNTGDKIKITQGVISEIEQKPVQPMQPMPQQMPQQMTQEQFDAAITEQKTAFEAQINAITGAAKAEKEANEKALSELKGQFEQALQDATKQSETIKQLFELVEKIAATPVAPAPETPRTGFQSKAEKREAKLMGIAKSLKEIQEQK